MLFPLETNFDNLLKYLAKKKSLQSSHRPNGEHFYRKKCVPKNFQLELSFKITLLDECELKELHVPLSDGSDDKWEQWRRE